MPNGTLLEFVRENPDVKRISLVQSFPGIALDRERDLSKLLDVAEGLDYLHANHITHGNLKGVGVFLESFWASSLTLGLGQYSRRSRPPRSFDEFRARFNRSWRELHNAGQSMHCSMGRARDPRGKGHNHTGSGRVCFWNGYDRGLSACSATSSIKG